MLKKIICGATLLCAAGFTQAATLAQTLTVTPASTNFSTSVSYAQFDDMGGTLILTGVTTSVVGSVFSDASLESLDASPTTLNVAIDAVITVSDASMNTLVASIPTVSTSFSATVFDGVSDFAGTSGTSITGLTGSQSASGTYTDAMTLAMFTGTGTGTFNFNAVATSIATGAGNLVAGFATSAGGQITVTYTYENAPITPVSAPANLALFGLGLLAFAGYRKARK